MKFRFLTEVRPTSDIITLNFVDSKKNMSLAGSASKGILIGSNYRRDFIRPKGVLFVSSSMASFDHLVFDAFRDR